jgi:hypothetical protein
MWRIFGGAALVVAGIAAFIEAHSHHPERFFTLRERRQADIGVRFHASTRGLSQAAYDLLRIGAWALLIFGVLLVVVGLISYARRGTP